MARMPKQKPGRSKQDYGTPREFILAVKELLQISEFDIDLAASADNAKAELFYDKDIDALVQPWDVGQGWNWLNPEFARISPWVERAYYHAVEYGTKTAVLIPAGVGSNWWRDWVHGKAMVHFLNGRITFDGTPPNPRTGKVDAYPKDCALLLYARAEMHYIEQGDWPYDIWTWQK
jgi:phage N-6-adenine-methyltransferase